MNTYVVLARAVAQCLLRCCALSEPLVGCLVDKTNRCYATKKGFFLRVPNALSRYTPRLHGVKGRRRAWNAQKVPHLNQRPTAALSPAQLHVYPLVSAFMFEPALASRSLFATTPPYFFIHVPSPHYSLYFRRETSWILSDSVCCIISSSSLHAFIACRFRLLFFFPRSPP